MATAAPHRLFFAVFLDAEAGEAASALGSQLRLQHQLRGRVQPVERLHVTLHWLRDHESLPADLVRAAKNAGARAADGAAPFEVVFDRAETLGESHPPGKRPLVLSGAPATLTPLRAFQRMLGGAMSDAGIGRYARSAFKPHITLLRDELHVAAHPVRPLRWTVRELVLVDSCQGRYEALGRWPLTSRQLPATRW